MRTVPFLWEIGCEEFPADWLPPLLGQLGDVVGKRFEEQGFGSVHPQVYGTLRRLVVHVPRLPERQPDRREQLTGPPARIAKTETGEWSRAALGFAKKNKMPPGKLRIFNTAKGDYVGFVRMVRGRPTAKLLPPLMAATLRSLSFPKFMVWDAELPDGRGAFPFGRPIRWIVCLLGKKVVPFEVLLGDRTRVKAGNKSRGHRFLAPKGRSPGAPFTVASFRQLKSELRRHSVVLDPDERQDLLEKGVAKLEKKADTQRIEDLQPLTSRILADLVEWPGAILGYYPESFASLPEAVRNTVLIHHQKYIPLKDKPAFIAVTNMPSDRQSYIRKGSERVVVARLSDAKFFWEEDQKTRLDQRRDRLAGVLFQAELGTYRDKVNRMAALGLWLAEHGQAPSNLVERAIALAKCDLTTQMVGEFPELQGIVGALYAREEGEPEQVTEAIRTHYRPLTLEIDDDFPTGEVAAIVSLADKLDTLAGMFRIGKVPTGSRDPFGLRRQALGVIRVLLEGERRCGLRVDLPLGELLGRAVDGVATVGAIAGATDDDTGRSTKALYEFFTERVRYVLSREFRYDEIASVFALGALELPARELYRRLAAVAQLRGSDDFEALSVAFKRVRNILSDQRPGGINPRAFTEEAEKKLWAAFKAIEPNATALVAEGEYGEALHVLSRLRPEVDTFFDKVLVMAPDPSLRDNRLALLHALQSLFTKVADLSEIVTGPGPGSS